MRAGGMRDAGCGTGPWQAACCHHEMASEEASWQGCPDSRRHGMAQPGSRSQGWEEGGSVDGDIRGQAGRE